MFEGLGEQIVFTRDFMSPNLQRDKKSCGEGREEMGNILSDHICSTRLYGKELVCGIGNLVIGRLCSSAVRYNFFFKQSKNYKSVL